MHSEILPGSGQASDYLGSDGALAGEVPGFAARPQQQQMADAVEATRGNYNPAAIVDSDEDLKRVMHLLECGHFNSFESCIFDDITASLLSPHDPWMTLADFRSYVDTQNAVASAYQDREAWVRMSILNTASSGHFSTDRTMREYNEEIWKLQSA